MLQTQNPRRYDRTGGSDAEFDAKVRTIRKAGMVAAYVFGGTVMGGVVGLFVYAQSKTPNVHDGVFAVIQIVGVVLGLVMGLIAARGIEAQDQLLEASHRAGISMLKKYKPKPGAGQHNVGERVIGPTSNAGEEYLKTLLSAQAKTAAAPEAAAKAAPSAGPTQAGT